MPRLKILDWYTHQGHQYEFFKGEHDFYLAGLKGRKPKWNREHRPLNSNVKIIDDRIAAKMKFDVVIIRSPIPKEVYYPHIKRGAVPIAVVQTTNPFPIPKETRYTVWNSVEVMKKYKSAMPESKHRYIVHGYDPDEFYMLPDTRRNGKVLTVANVFKKRSKIMGFPLWHAVSKKVKKLDVIGHGNLDLYPRDRQAKNLKSLIRTYNIYSVYFNPTHSSAMPRSRAEAAMCGMPIVSTDNYDINRYFKHNKSSILTNDPGKMISGINQLLANDSMRRDYGMSAREVAIKHFHIDDFLGKWNRIFEDL